MQRSNADLRKGRGEIEKRNVWMRKLNESGEDRKKNGRRQTNGNAKQRIRREKIAPAEQLKTVQRIYLYLEWEDASGLKLVIQVLNTEK